MEIYTTESLLRLRVKVLERIKTHSDKHNYAEACYWMLDEIEKELGIEPNEGC